MNPEIKQEIKYQPEIKPQPEEPLLRAQPKPKPEFQLSENEKFDIKPKQMKKQQRQQKPSILDKLKKFKDIVAKTPRKDKEKKKEQTR